MYAIRSYYGQRESPSEGSSRGRSPARGRSEAGGVICAAMEYHGSTQSAALQSIEEKLRRNTEQVLETARRKQILPRQAAMAMAEERVRKAMSFRRWSLISSAPDYT